jgi:hypothetical protein
MSDEVEEAIENHVASLSADPNEVQPFTLLRSDEDSVPVLLDLPSYTGLATLNPTRPAGSGDAPAGATGLTQRRCYSANRSMAFWKSL